MLDERFSDREARRARTSGGSSGGEGPADASARSARGRGRGDEPHPEPAQRLGLPSARPVPDPRQAGELGVAADDQVGERAPGEVRRRHAVADVAAGAGDARRSVVGDVRMPVARARPAARPSGTGSRRRRAPGTSPTTVARSADRTRSSVSKRRRPATRSGTARPGRRRRCARRRCAGRRRRRVTPR